MNVHSEESIAGIRLGWDEQYTSEDLAPAYATAVAAGVRHMESLGVEIVPVKMPERLREFLEAWPVICSSEAANAHSDTYPAQAAQYGSWFREWLRRGRAHTGTDYAKANSLRADCVGELRNTMLNVDALAFPGSPSTAESVTPESMYGPIPDSRSPWSSRFTVPFDYIGWPTINMPCGISEEGLPFSLQFAAHALQEPLLIQLGDAYQRSTDFHLQHPPGW
jgi:amidase